MSTLNESLNIVLQIQNVDLLKIFVPPFISFIIGMLSVPFILKFMARFNLQKKKEREANNRWQAGHTHLKDRQ